jgi:RHS repeat-associated protein
MREGLRQVSFDTACWPDGAAQVKVVAFGCSSATATGTTSFTIEDGVETHVTMSDNANGELTAHVDWTFTDAPGTVTVKLLDPLSGSTTLDSFVPEQLTGAKDYTVAVSGPKRTIRVEATATRDSCRYDYDVAAKECGCKNAVGDPVDIADGNMRYSDSEPLPSPGGPSLSRVYDTFESTRGSFGVGWTSMFDAVVRPNLPASVLVKTDQNIPFVFQKERAINGTFEQKWPRSSSPGQLTFNTSANNYSFRQAGDARRWIFSASTGRLTEIRDETAGRSTLFTYDATGRPATVADSWGTWSWTITTEPTSGFISSISVDGSPEIVWTYQYDASGHLTSVGAPGATQWRAYDYSGGLMTNAWAAVGNLIESHTYDGQGRAISSSGPTDELTSIEHEASGSTATRRITRVTKATGGVSEYRSMLRGGTWRPAEVEGGCASCGSSRDETIAYDEYGLAARDQNAAGYITSNEYDTLRRLTSTTIAMRPSGCDPETDASRCRLSSEALALTSLEPTAASATITYEYANTTWPERVTTSRTASVLVAGGTKETAIVYHGTSGAVVTSSSTGYTGATPALSTRITTNTFYGEGTDPNTPAFDPGGVFLPAWMSLPQPSLLRRTADGPRTDVSDVTSWVYYPVHNSVPPLFRGRVAAARNAAGHIMRYEAYDVFGHATRIVDANGVATEMAADALGRIISTTTEAVTACDTTIDPLCGTDLTSTRTYLGAGPVQTEQQPGGGVNVYAYDGRGRLQTVSRGPSTADLRERREQQYDPVTGKKLLERKLANEGGNWIAKYTQSFTYDAEGRLQTVTHADGSAIHYTYDAAGRTARIRDENHSTPNTTYAYDAAGHVSAVRQTLAATQIATTYTYDTDGNLTSVSDPNGNVTSYTYDDFGQLLSQTSAVTGVTTYGYDLAGNLLTTVDANAATTTRVYDALGRTSSAASSRPGVATETVQWQYDDPTSGRFGIGRLTQMSDPAGTTTYSYERRGLLRREERAFTGLTGSYVISFRFDANANRSRIEYPSGLNVTYGFDSANRPISVTASGASGGTTLVSAASYLPFGPLNSLAFGNGMTQSMSADDRYRITQNKPFTATAPLAQYDYDYDPLGNIVGISDALDGGYSRAFAYDDLNRLVTANTGDKLWRTGSYSYDAMGNMLSLRLGEVIRPPEPGDQSRRHARTDVTTLPLGRVTTFAYLDTTPKLTTVTTNDLDRPVSYDAAGNETTYAIDRVYSSRNLLAAVVEPLEGLTHQINYGYDGRGLRVMRSEPPAAGGNSTRYFTYSPEFHLLSISSDDSPNPWVRGPQVNAAAPPAHTEIIWFGSRPIAQVTDSSSVALTFADHLGTPLLQTSFTTTPSVIWRAEYEPFGNVYEMRDGNRTDQPLRFPGQEVAMTLEGQEENYNIFRWYRSGWGRYSTADRYLPASTATNAFSYAEQNPVRLLDPLGLFAIDASCDCSGVNIPKTIAQASKYLGSPKCQEILQKYSFVPFDGKGSKKETLLDCMKRRFGPSEVGQPPTILCFKGEGPCGQTVPATMGVPTAIKLWVQATPCPIDKPAFGLKQTLFHETMHSCGQELENEAFYTIQKICTGM